MRRGAVIFALGLFAGSCGKAAAPTAPLVTAPVAAAPVFADFSGVTLVSYKESTCKGWRNCFAMVGQTRSVELRLTQSVGSVSGVLIESTRSAFRVSGAVSPDGELTLTGWRPRVETYRGGDDHGRGIDTFKLRRSADGKTTGTVLLIGDWAGYEVGAPGTAFEGGDVTSAERTQMFPVQTGFGGTWHGRYIVKSCVATGIPVCYPADPGEVPGFTMTLSPSGELVNGLITAMAPVSGTVSGDALLLSGDGFAPGNPDIRGTITAWDAYRDAAGELRGTFTYVAETKSRRTVYECELYFVMLDSAATTAVK